MTPAAAPAPERRGTPGVGRVAALVVAVSLLVMGWNAAATRELHAGVFVAALAVCAASVAAGAWLPALLGARADRCDGFAARAVAGFLTIDIVAFALYVVLPWGVTACLYAACVLGAVVGLAAARARGTAWLPAVPASELVVTAFAAVAVTLWCQDYLSPLQAQGDEFVVQGWQDIFLHMRTLSALAQSHGVRSLQNLTLAGVPGQVYHYASYLPAAALVELHAADALQAFATCMVPVGMLLAAHAAYALASALVTRAAGAAAALALMLLPDALQQGFGNEMLAYHCIQAVAPGALYGVAAAAIGWLLLVEACRSGRRALVLAGWIAIASVVAFKAQLFVANAYPAFVFPIAFMPRMLRSLRAAALVAATVVFAAAVVAGNSLHAAPLMRLDGSGAGGYARILALAQEPRPFFGRALQHVMSMPAGIVRVAVLALLVLPLTFGAWLVLLPVALWRAAPRVEIPVVAFPLAVLATYVVMSSALALDTHGAGSPEELMHRPFVWAYFVACTWSAAMLWHAAFGERAPRGAARVFLLCVAVAALAVPWHFGRDVQSLPLWMPRPDGIHLPACMVREARYIRASSMPQAVIQVSDGDPREQWSALAQRQAFAIDLANGMLRTPEKESRLQQLRAVRESSDAATVESFMASHRIEWYVAVPAAPVAWAAALESRVAERCGGYAVYRFTGAK